jgi:predicted phosphodiesterase/biotin operon repressor
MVGLIGLIVTQAVMRLSKYPELHNKEAFQSLLEECGSFKEMARYLDCAYSYVHKSAAKLGIKSPNKWGQRPTSLKAESPNEYADLLHYLKQPATIEVLCEHVDRSPSTVRRWIEELQTAGYQVMQLGDKYSLTKTPPLSEAKVDKRVNKTKITFGVVSDTHLCSKNQQLTFLKDFYQRCADRGIDTVYHCGDMIDGEGLYRGHEHSIFVHGFDDQVAYAIENYPKVEGITTELVGGNHDLVYVKRAGADPCVPISNARSDIVYHGPYSAWIQIAENALMYLLHPDGGSAYAHSYKLQKIIESFEGGKKPRLTFVGHWHMWNHTKARNVDGWLPGCFQSQTEYERRKALQPVIGGNIITVEFDDEGDVRHVTPEFYQYLVPKEKDY